MRKFTILAVVCLLTLAVVPSAQQSDALKAAGDALGVANIKTLGISGSGANFSVGQQPAAAPGNQLERMLMLWATPQGFVKAAMANNATTKAVPGGTEVSFMVGGKYKMTGLINTKNEVEKVQTWIDQSIVGDMPV